MTLVPGQSRTTDHGPHGTTVLTVTITRHWDGVHLLVMNGPRRSEALTRPFGNHELPDARFWLREITSAAEAGVRVLDIENRMSALADAGYALAPAELEASR